MRVTHWLTVLAFAALLLSGIEILISHPRFYWGETGHSLMRPLFRIPVPSSRGSVPSGYGYVMPDQNGWSRSLHFEAAWLLVLTVLVYGWLSLWTGHLRDLLPPRADLNWRAIRDVLADSLRWPGKRNDASAYNVVQRLSYLAVLFVLFPLVLWTGLALSPAFNAAFPIGVHLLGGRQSARTLHFVVTCLLVLFLVVHVAMVAHGGFRRRMRAMTIGGGKVDDQALTGAAVTTDTVPAQVTSAQVTAAQIASAQVASVQITREAL